MTNAPVPPKELSGKENYFNEEVAAMAEFIGPADAIFKALGITRETAKMEYGNIINSDEKALGITFKSYENGDEATMQIRKMKDGKYAVGVHRKSGKEEIHFSTVMEKGVKGMKVLHLRVTAPIKDKDGDAVTFDMDGQLSESKRSLDLEEGQDVGTYLTERWGLNLTSGVNEFGKFKVDLETTMGALVQRESLNQGQAGFVRPAISWQS